MKRFKHILCVIEPGEGSKVPLERAVSLAERNQASLTVVGVIERITTGKTQPAGCPNPIELQAAMAREYEQQLRPLLAPHRDRIRMHTRILKGVPFLEIIRDVLRNGHDLVIKGPENHGYVGRLFGSDDMHLLCNCPCPVWLVKPLPPKGYRSILAAVDIGEGYPALEKKNRQALSMKILEKAASVALLESSELHVVHVWDAVGESAMRGIYMKASEKQIAAYVEWMRRQHEQEIDALLQELNTKLGQESMRELKLQVHLVRGPARTGVPQQAVQLGADLVIMGTVGRTGVAGFFMGNTAETILSQLDCSVLAVKPPGFVTPVTEV